MTSEENSLQGTAKEKVIRLVRPSIVVLCGPAACGKSAFAARHFRPTQIVSSDRARGLVCDDERDQRYQTQAFALVHFLIEQRLSINRLCVVDSTALTPQARQNLLDLARKYPVPCVVLLLDVPLETCLARDQLRERSVGAAVIERQHRLFEQANAAIKQEGYDQVVELRDEDLGKVRFEVLFRPVSGVAPAVARPESVTRQRGTPPAWAAASGQGRSPSEKLAPQPRGPAAAPPVSAAPVRPPAPFPASSSAPAVPEGSSPPQAPKAATQEGAPAPGTGASPAGMPPSGSGSK